MIRSNHGTKHNASIHSLRRLLWLESSRFGVWKKKLPFSRAKCLALLVSFLGTPPAVADIFVSLSESGGNTTLTFTGSLDTSLFGAPEFVGLDGSSSVVSSLSTFEGGSGATNSFTRWDGIASGYTDFNSGSTIVATSSSFGRSIFAINYSNGDIDLPENLTGGGIFNINDTATFAGSPSDLGWDTTPFTLSLPGMQSIFFFPDAPDPPDSPDEFTMNMGAIHSANTTGTFLPNTQSGAQQGMTNTALNALHNQRIVRARSGMGNPRASSDTLAQSDRHLTKFLNFAANQGMTLGQALGVEEAPASVRIDDTMDKVSDLFRVEVPAGGKMVYEDKVPLVDPNRWEIFTVGDYGHHDQDALDTVNRGFQSRTWAGSVGFEYMVCNNFNFGMAYTYADNDIDLDEGLGNIDIEGHLASVYATGFFDNKYIDILYSYGTYENSIRRNTLTAGGFAFGNPDSDSHTFSINAGQNFDLGDGLVTGPTFGYDYTEGAIDAYNETGGGAAAINYLGRDYSSSITSLGWQITKTKEVKQGVLSIQGFAAWEHEFNPEAGNVRGSLATSPFAVNGLATGSFQFNSPGAAPGTDWMALGASARLACHCGVAVSVDYQTQLFRDDVSAHYAGLKLSGEF